MGGYLVGLRFNDQEALELVNHLIPKVGVPSSESTVHILISFRRGGKGETRGARNYYLVHHGWTQIVRTLDESEAIKGFQQTCLSEMVVPKPLGEAAFHEGSVLHFKDSAVALIGSPEQRDTCTQFLIKKGFRLISSNHIVVNQSGSSIPCPGPNDPPITVSHKQTYPKLGMLMFLGQDPPAQPTHGTSVIRLLKESYGTGQSLTTMLCLTAGLQGTRYAENSNMSTAAKIIEAELEALTAN
jgi:hypothetical protein